MINEVIINGYSIKTGSNMTLSFCSFDGGIIKDIQTFQNPYRNGDVLYSDKNRSKNIEILGTIKGSSIEDTNNLIDSFKLYILQNGPLEILFKRNMGGTTQNLIGYGSVINDDIIQRDGQWTTFARFKIMFQIHDGFVFNDIEQTTTIGTVDSGPTGYLLTGSGIIGYGSAYVYPKVEIEVLENTSFYELIGEKYRIKVEDSFVVGDTIIIDSTLETILKNGTTLLDFRGTFPIMHPLDGPITIGTEPNKTFSMDVKYYPSYY